MSRTVGSASHPFNIRPLAKRERPEDVVNQLGRLVGLEWPTLCRRISERDTERELSKEVLVTILRFYINEKDHQKADFIFVELVKRLSGAIASKLVKWRSISGSEMEDTRQFVILRLHEYFYSLESNEELWECNFKTCFDLRLINIFGKLARARTNTVSTTVEYENEEGGSGTYDFPDAAAETQFKNIEVIEALDYLDSVNPNLGKVFYLKFFSDLSEGEIAKIMEVHERTIRNWITSSKKVLIQFYAER